MHPSKKVSPLTLLFLPNSVCFKSNKSLLHVLIAWYRGHREREVVGEKREKEENETEFVSSKYIFARNVLSSAMEERAKGAEEVHKKKEQE